LCDATAVVYTRCDAVADAALQSTKLMGPQGASWRGEWALPATLAAPCSWILSPTVVD